MKNNYSIILVLFGIFLLNSCASLKENDDAINKVEQISPFVDTVFIDYKTSLPETKYHVFRASKDGKSGWMNVDGEWIVPPEYDTEFKRAWSEGVNICRKGGMYGAVNYKNEIVLPFAFKYPPANCSNALILVKDSLRQEAYFSKEGVQMSDFEKRQPEFNNGFAIVRKNRNILASYPRIDLENSSRTTNIYTCDFAVINTKFDTLLHFKSAPFSLEFGSLNNNRRSFFLYPYMGLHADLGISYGQYGYLDGNGNIVVEPKFRASDVFIRVRGGFVREPDCPFNANLSMVRELEKYYFIDTSGNKAFDLQSNREKIYDVSFPNNCGVVGYRTFGKEANSSMIHLINRNGEILHEANESDAPMTLGGAIGNSPGNDFIPILDRKSGFLRIYSSCFEEIIAFQLKDSLSGASYRYEGFENIDVSHAFTVIQKRSTPTNSYGHLKQKRLIDDSGQAKSSWFPNKSILSNTYGNFSFLDTATMTNTLYDFDKNKLFECDSCFFDYSNKMRFFGVYKIWLPNKGQFYVNYKGKELHEFFDSMEENISDISSQVKNYKNNSPVVLGAKEKEFEKYFEESIMYKRILK